jgi:hypothetical protein
MPEITHELTTAESKAEQVRTPDWVGWQPVWYGLEASAMIGHNGDAEGTIEQFAVTEDEYLSLKCHLARLRGYHVPEVQADAA